MIPDELLIARQVKMYKVKNRFEELARKYPYYSTYVVFAETIRGTGLTENTIRRWFYRLVEADDYAQDEVRSVLRHLVKLA